MRTVTWKLWMKCGIFMQEKRSEDKGFGQPETIRMNAIMGSQLKEEEFRKYCNVVIDNSDTLTDAYRQIDEKLGEYLWQK